jgi:succinate dehydrogenase / fumarate reductase cytochrome b subunit
VLLVAPTPPPAADSPTAYPMISWPGKFLSTSVGKKTVMAVTGLSLVGFLVVHLIGNINLWAGGDEAFNEYAEHLESYGWLLNAAEIGLLALFVVHAGLALKLTAENRAARPVGYRRRQVMGGMTPGSSTMLVTGLILLLFVVIHVVDFRLPKLAGEIDDLAGAVRDRLSSPVGAGIYLVGVIALGVHLSHAIQSAFQTLGLHHPRWTPLVRIGGRALALLLAAGFATFPLFLFFGGSAQ